MATTIEDSIFGPVPSRRLGRSCGINIIPRKHCSYSCIYCQIGNTNHLHIDRRTFFDPGTILRAVETKLEMTRKSNIPVDYFTFVANGEPTLDKNLGDLLERSKSLEIKTALISNASLIQNRSVQELCQKADWVSLKIDAVQKEIWQKINRPHPDLRLDQILNGILAFKKTFQGTLATETMLVRECNDGLNHLTALSQFLAQLNPDIAYLSIPIRPPAVSRVTAPDAETINTAYCLIKESIDRVEALTAYEGNAFDRTGGIEDSILSITSVHPMREDAMEEFLFQGKADWSIVMKMMQEKKLVRRYFGTHNYYLRPTSG